MNDEFNTSVAKLIAATVATELLKLENRIDDKIAQVHDQMDRLRKQVIASELKSGTGLSPEKMRTIADLIVSYVQREIEKQPLRYEGVFESGKAYGKGAFVTCDGSVWHCDENTTSRPGHSRQWTLAVKSGR